MLIEAAIDSAEDAERAVAEGALRLEVCGDLATGGVTPPVALLRRCLGLGVPCVAMARPRGGSFIFSAAEEERIVADAQSMLNTGAHGIVFGSLRVDGRIDVDSVRRMVRVASGAETVFHRAFDRTPDALAGLETLIDCGVTRILTSGHAPTALEGVAEIGALMEHAGGRITILPGGTVRGENVRDIVRGTGARQVHARGSVAGVIAGIRHALAVL
ncbi:MAG TPA: copper homeostasis protein CutC [Gemmatimonadaceae bacterium]|nr:copper homeostasis protein CutC [Gemmatimonadaceae bacterium]